MQLECQVTTGGELNSNKYSASLISRVRIKGITRPGKNPTVAGEWGVLQIVREFVDKGISGAKGREQGPESDALWKEAIRKELDVVMVGRRPLGPVALTPGQLPLSTQILKLRREGHGIGAIGKLVGISSKTVWRFLRGIEASSQVHDKTFVLARCYIVRIGVLALG